MKAGIILQRGWQALTRISASAGRGSRQRQLRRSVRHRACGRQEGLLKAPAANRWRQVRANSTTGSPPGALRKRIPQKSASACHASMNHALYCSRGRFVLLPLRGALRSAAADHRYANTL